jgi:hypothetical protein
MMTKDTNPYIAAAMEEIRLAGHRRQWEEQAIAIDKLIDLKLAIALEAFADRIEQASGIRR